MIAEFSSSPKTAQNMVLDILSTNPSLTAKRIFNMAKKRHMCGIKYRTFHKHLIRFLDIGMLERNEVKEYMLSPKWIGNLRSFIDRVDIKQQNNKWDINNSDNVNFITFYNLHEFSEFIISFRKDTISNLENADLFFLGDHLWLSLFYLGDIADGLQKLKKRKLRYHIKVRGDTRLDRAVVNMYKSFGAEEAKSGVKDDGDYVIYIYGDVMILMTRPRNIRIEIDKVFQTTNNLTDLNLGRLFENIIMRPSIFHATVIKNRKIVENYKSLIKIL